MTTRVFVKLYFAGCGGYAYVVKLIARSGKGTTIRRQGSLRDVGELAPKRVRICTKDAFWSSESSAT